MLVLALAVAQPAGSLTCSLVTPGAENVSFTVASQEAAGMAVIAPATGSVWPSAPVAGTRRDAGGDGSEIAIGGRGGLLLNVGSPLALLSRSDGRRATVPVAVGVCRNAAAADASVAVSGTVSNDVPAFDPARWPQDCGLLLSDGRRLRFDYTLAGPNGPVRIESGVLWGNRPVTTRRLGGAGGSARFGGEAGPAGTERMYGSGSARAKVIAFTRVGDPETSAQTGIGICGYNNIVRRPAIQ